MDRVIILSFIVFLTAFELHGQTPPQPSAQSNAAKPFVDPKQAAEDFIDRFNALSNWHISLDGKEEGVDQVVNHVAELFAPDVIAEVPPNDPEQIGPVMLVGNGQVRGWLDKIARSQVNLGYILRRQTTKEFEGELLVYSTPLPWGGTGISFQIIGNYAQREDRKRFMAPGAIFLQYGPDGKVHRLRLLVGEIEEVQ